MDCLPLLRYLYPPRQVQTDSEDANTDANTDAKKQSEEHSEKHSEKHSEDSETGESSDYSCTSGEEYLKEK
jgi:hypothetical protein